MSDDHEIVQSRFGYKNRFHFGEDQLKFSSRDASGESTRSINYEMINIDSSSTVTIDAGKRYYLIILVIGIASTMIIQSMCPGRLDLAWAATGISVATYFALRYLNVISLTFTMLRPTSGGGTIRITHDKLHDQVLQRIRSGWIGRMRKLHLAVNLENNPKQEERKFKWLLDNGVISEAEHEDAIGQISSEGSGGSVDGEAAAHLH